MDRELSDGLNEHFNGLRRYALSLTRDSVDADDLVQECFKRAITYIRTGSDIKNLRAYLFTILNNAYMDELSKRRRRGMTVDVDDVADAVAYPAQQVLRLDCRDLSDAYDSLPTSQRNVIKLVALDGMSYKSAAKELDVPVGTVMSRLNRGRASMRQHMSGHKPMTKRSRQMPRREPRRHPAMKRSMPAASKAVN